MGPKLDVTDWKSPTLAADLEKELLAHLPPADAADEHKPPPEVLDTLHALLAQAVSMAASHGLSVPGALEIAFDDKTDRPVMLSAHAGEAVYAQNLDPREVDKAATARKLAARKLAQPAKPAAAVKPPPFAGAPAARRS
jgi:hypothetical protein